MTALLIFLLVALAWVAWEDFRTRTLPLWLLLAVAAIALVIVWKQADLHTMICYFGFNLMFVVMQFSVITLYYFIRNRKLVNIVNKYIGSGDIVFLIVCCLLFSPFNFIFFQIISSTLLLVIYTIIRMVRGTAGNIPLAGALAIAINMFIVMHWAGMPVHFYDDRCVINFLLFHHG